MKRFILAATTLASTLLTHGALAQSLQTPEASEFQAEALNFAPNFYATVCIYNKANRTVKVQYGWNGGAWNFVNLAPSTSWSYWYKFSFPNENKAPKFLISIHSPSQGQVNYHTYGYGAPTTSCSTAKAVYIKNVGPNFYAEGEKVFSGL